MKKRYQILLLIILGIGLIGVMNVLEGLGKLQNYHLIAILIIAFIGTGLLGKNK